MHKILVATLMYINTTEPRRSSPWENLLNLTYDSPPTAMRKRNDDRARERRAEMMGRLKRGRPAFYSFCLDEVVPIRLHSGEARCGGPSFLAYADNYLIDLKFGLIVMSNFSRHPPGRGGRAKTMIERTEECFGLKPERLAADTAPVADYAQQARANSLIHGRADMLS